MNPVDEHDFIAGGNRQRNSFPDLVRKDLEDRTGDRPDILIRKQCVGEIEDPVMKAVFPGCPILLDESRFDESRKDPVCFRLWQTHMSGDIAEAGFDRHTGKGLEYR